MAKNNTGSVFMDLKGLHARIKNIRRVNDRFTSFTIKCDGFSLYGMKLVHSGKNEYILPPSVKGKDGEYYDQYAVYLSDEDKEKLITMIHEELDKQQEKSDGNPWE